MKHVIVSDESEVISEIKRRIEKSGSQRKVALELGISPPYLNDILSGRRMISETVAKSLGYIRVLHFVKLDDGHDKA